MQKLTERGLTSRSDVMRPILLLFHGSPPSRKSCIPTSTLLPGFACVQGLCWTIIVRAAMINDNNKIRNSIIAIFFKNNHCDFFWASSKKHLAKSFSGTDTWNVSKNRLLVRCAFPNATILTISKFTSAKKSIAVIFLWNLGKIFGTASFYGTSPGDYFFKFTVSSNIHNPSYFHKK